MRLPKVTTYRNVRNPYARRLLSYIAGEDPLEVLASGPAALRRSVRGLTPAELRRRPAPGKWPIAWLAHHLCDAEVGFSYRIRLILAQSGTAIQAYDQDRWSKGLSYGRRSVSGSVALFTEMRRANLELLHLASRGDLRRFGMHEERGKETVVRLSHLVAGHDLNHLRQIRAIRKGLGKR